MKHGAIKALAGEHPVRQLCRVFGVARSAYYAAQAKAERPRARDNVRLGAKVRELFEASGRTYGSPRLTAALAAPHDRQPPPLPHRAQPLGRAGCPARATG